MANTKSAKKHARTSERKRLINKSNKGTLRTELKTFRRMLDDKDTKSPERLSKVYEVIDRAVHKGILHRNAAARYKSRLTRKSTAAAKTS